jgi:hypothetical protein
MPKSAYSPPALAVRFMKPMAGPTTVFPTPSMNATSLEGASRK